MTHPRRSSPLLAALLCLTLTAGQPAAAAVSRLADVHPVLQPLPSHKADAGMWAVKLDVAALRSARPGETFRLALPDGRFVDLVFDALLGGGNWIGHHAAGREYAVRLRLDGQLAAGIVRTPEGAFVLGHVDGVQLMGPDLSADADPVAVDVLPPMFVTDRSDAARQAGSTSDADQAPPAEGAHPVMFNLVALSALEPGDEVAMSIPGHGDYRVTFDATSAGAADTSAWVGHLTDYGSEFRVIISSGPDGSVGNILTPSGELMLVDTGGRQWLVDPVSSGLSQLESEHADSVGVDLSAAAGGMAEGGTTAAGSITTTTTTTASSGTASLEPVTTIDLLVLYTPGFKKKYGSVYATRIAQLVALANQAYVDSGVPIRLRMVASTQINDKDTTTNSSTLSALARGKGAYRTVPSLRKKYGADLVTVVRPFYMTAQGSNCGVGYIGGYNGSNIAAYGAYAYSVVSDGRDMAGTNYYCTDYTFTHELGHNMGLMHDRDTVARQGGGQGSHPYAFGYGRSGSFGSIMSYISPVVGLFSNPDLNVCGNGSACGVAVEDPASAHNALALTSNRLAVSAWSGTTVPSTYQVSGTVSRRGRAVAGVPMLASDGGVCSASGRTGAYACTVPWGWTGSITPQVSGSSVLPGSIVLKDVKVSRTRRNFILR